MRPNPFSRLALATLLATALFAAAAVAGERSKGVSALPETKGPVWPAPPAAARVQFVQTVEGASDWGLARSWWGRVVDRVTGRHETRFIRPTGVAERDGVLYVADPGAQCLVVFDAPRHKELRIARAGEVSLVSPVAVAAGPQSTIYLVDSYLKQVLRFDRDGRLVQTITGPDLERPSSIVHDPARQRLYVGDSKAHVVHVFDEQGHKVGSVGRLGTGPGEFNSPTHLALTRAGDLIVTDALNFRVQVLGPDGTYRYRVGEVGDGAGNLAAPKGVAADSEGNVFVADAMFDAVQIFDRSGRLLLGFGEQGQTAGRFWLPNGLYVDGTSRLYVADAYNRRVQVFQLLTVPGSETRGEQAP